MGLPYDVLSCAVMALEGAWLGWGLLFLVLAPSMISDDLYIKNKTLEALKSLPVEIVE